MARGFWISSTPGWPMMSCNGMMAFRLGAGIGPSFFAANCDRLVVPVFGLTVRFAIGVVVKNGWAYRNAVDGAPADFLAVVRAAFLAGRFELLAFFAIDLSPRNAWSSRRSRRRSVPVVGSSGGLEYVRSARPNRIYQYLAITTVACSAALLRPAVQTCSVSAIVHL